MANDEDIREEGRSRRNIPDGGVGFWTQTKLLAVKNWKCKLRSGKKKLAGELLLPVFYLFLLSILVKSQPPATYPAETNPSTIEPVSISSALSNVVIGVVPDSKEAKEVVGLMKQISKSQKLGSGLEFVFFPSVNELESAYASGKEGSDRAIVFSEISKTTKSFNYTIMTESGGMISPPSTSRLIEGLSTCRKNKDGSSMLEPPTSCPVNGYYYSGFLALQQLADHALFQYSTGKVAESLDIKMENYPKSAYTEGMSIIMRAIIPIYSVIPMAQLINNLLVMVVTEKEDRIKDGFRMIGVSDSAYWLSWFSVYSLLIGVLSVLFTIVMHFTNVLRNLNIAILFLVFFFFGLSVITFAFALTPFFHKPKTAGLVGTLIMQFCGMLFLLQTFLKTSDSYLLPMRLISSLAFTTALDEACEYEYSGGIELTDLWPNRRGARILYSLIFIIVDTIIYGIIAVYLDNVIPNEYGAKKHPLFCFKSGFGVEKESTTTVGYRRSSLSHDNLNENDCQDPNVERVPASMIGKEAIRIRNVFKTYTSLWSSTKVKAVKGVSIDIYDGQITAILGKNGAGKSTLLSILTGLVPPSSGNCTVFGMNTNDPADMDKLRRITGVCLQTDLLFPAMTSEEHLELYGKLRGLKGAELNHEINSLLNDLKLSEKSTTRAENLSGGQKRKLSVAIALIGDPKIILLDEPSAGVDPVSRRHLWSLLKKKKEGRVILLTTHFLDEADFLADRKAVIHEGVLKCHGSSLFLKNRFGVGYHLTVEAEGQFDVTECDDIVRNLIPQALHSRQVIGKEVKYCLPHSEVHAFADLFSDLERAIEKSDSPFKSYGVSMTTLEEVFLKICNDAWEDKFSTSNNSATSESSSEQLQDAIDTEINLIPDLTEIRVNFAESLWALSLLRIRRLIRSPMSFFFMIIMPSLLVAGGLGLMKTQNVDVPKDATEFDLPAQLYQDEDQRRIAISGNIPSDFEPFLKNNELEPLLYSGIYSDLLNNDLSDPGTMLAINMKDSGIILSVNGTFPHGPPIIMNMLSKYLWHSHTNATTVTSAKSFSAKKSNIFDPTTFYAVFLIGPSFTFVAVGMVMELVKDREISARNHLRVNGVSFGLYFLSIFVVFGILSAIVILMQIALILIFAIPSFMNPYAITVAIVLLFLFVPSCLLFSAIFSYMFDRMESAQSVFSPISSWMGTIVGIVMIVVDSFSGPEKRSVVLLVHGIFSAVDVYYIPFGVFYWINKQYLLCSIQGSCDNLSFNDYMGPEFVIMAVCLIVQVPVFAILVVVADVVKSEGSPLAALRTLFLRTRRVDMNQSRIHILEDDQEGSASSTMEEDVLNEKARVEALLSGTVANDNSVVIVQNLKKTYQPNRSIQDRCKNRNVKGFEALKGINFAVEKGEVFGLLGHNGAGKTTAMRIIIAEESANSGRVRLCGTDIESSYSDAFLKLGYCAQHDPIWEYIELKEHLELYAVIRGIPKDKRKRIINQLMSGLQIKEHANKKATQLSGGTKRKLSYGISMLGAPRIVLLDEPSTGMDPQSKRFLWNTILGSFKDSRGAILTTHSMEEAEILSTRIAILAKGSLICIGSPQHLKSKYGTGYTLEIKLKSENPGIGTDTLSYDQRYPFVRENFPECTINEIFDDKAVFSLPRCSIQSISRTFSLLEQLKREYNIEEYSFSQTTLEQIFLLFAKDNENDEDGENTNA